MDKAEIISAVKKQVIVIAKQLGMDASGLNADDIIPATGLLDSAGLMQLIAWYEDFYQIPLSQEEINIDNLGTLDAMASFVLKRKGL